MRCRAGRFTAVSILGTQVESDEGRRMLSDCRVGRAAQGGYTLSRSNAVKVHDTCRPE
jgi:hypothetical protein